MTIINALEEYGLIGLVVITMIEALSVKATTTRVEPGGV
jgi:hypothetical protein